MRGSDALRRAAHAAVRQRLYDLENNVGALIDGVESVLNGHDEALRDSCRRETDGEATIAGDLRAYVAEGKAKMPWVKQ